MTKLVDITRFFTLLRSVQNDRIIVFVTCEGQTQCFLVLDFAGFQRDVNLKCSLWQREMNTPLKGAVLEQNAPDFAYIKGGSGLSLSPKGHIRERS